MDHDPATAQIATQWKYYIFQPNAPLNFSNECSRILHLALNMNRALCISAMNAGLPRNMNDTRNCGNQTPWQRLVIGNMLSGTVWTMH
jgi:hypothetical protein